MATLHICAYFDQEKQFHPTRPLLDLNHINMEPVPYLDLQGQYHSLCSEVLKALREIC